MKDIIRQLVHEEDGQDLVEYAFLVGFIALIAYIGVQTLGNTLNTYFGTTLAGAPPFSAS